MKHASSQPYGWMMFGAIVGLVFAFVMFAPATWLAGELAKASGGQVKLQGARGTVWQGSGDLVFSGGTGSLSLNSVSNRIEWRLRPRWLGLDMGLHLPCCTSAASPFKVSLHASVFDPQPNIRWQLDSKQVNLPAKFLMGLGAPWNTLQLSGSLSLSLDKLAGTLSNAQGLSNISGRATLDITEAATALSTVRPLGNYRLSSAGTEIKLETLSDSPAQTALMLSGAGRFEQGRVSFLGEATAGKGYEEALSNLLHIIGQWQPSPDGRSRSILKL